MLIQEITDYFCNLVRIDSPSGSEEKVREFLCRELKEIAGEGQIDPAGNLKFTLPGTLPGPVCLFSSHMDTVEPGRKISPQMGEDGRIHSDGTTVLGADDKDGITALVFALKRLHREKAPHVPLEFLFTAGEEKSLSGSSKLSADFLKAEYAWVLDGPGTPGTIYRNGVGKIGFTITVTGKAAHAGICPEKGVNAFMLMAEAMQEFPPGRWENATVNYGTVSGGQANNIVPEKVFLTGEIRSHSPERLEELVQKMKQVWSGVGQIGFKSGYLPYEETDETFLKQTQSVFTSAGIQPVIKDFSAGSDANNLAKLGIKVCLLAMGRTDNHTCMEAASPEHILAMSDIAFRLMTKKWNDD